MSDRVSSLIEELLQAQSSNIDPTTLAGAEQLINRWRYLIEKAFEDVREEVRTKP